MEYYLSIHPKYKIVLQGNTDHQFVNKCKEVVFLAQQRCATSPFFSSFSVKRQNEFLYFFTFGILFLVDILQLFSSQEISSMDTLISNDLLISSSAAG